MKKTQNGKKNFQNFRIKDLGATATPCRSGVSPFANAHCVVRYAH